MTEAEADQAAHRLHQRIAAILTSADLKKIATFLREIYADGQTHRVAPGAIVEVTVAGGLKTWLAT